MRWNITTLSQIEKLGRVIEFSCNGCDRRQAFTVTDLVREYGGYSLPRDAARELFTGCPELAPARGILRCPYVFALLEPLKLSDCPEEIYIICGRRTVYGKPECGRRRYIRVDQWRRRYGNITVPDMLARARCTICRHKGADLI